MSFRPVGGVDPEALSVFGGVIRAVDCEVGGGLGVEPSIAKYPVLAGAAVSDFAGQGGGAGCDLGREGEPFALSVHKGERAVTVGKHLPPVGGRLEQTFVAYIPIPRSQFKGVGGVVGQSFGVDGAVGGVEGEGAVKEAHVAVLGGKNVAVVYNHPLVFFPVSFKHSPLVPCDIRDPVPPRIGEGESAVIVLLAVPDAGEGAFLGSAVQRYQIHPIGKADIDRPVLYGWLCEGGDFLRGEGVRPSVSGPRPCISIEEVEIQRAVITSEAPGGGVLEHRHVIRPLIPRLALIPRRIVVCVLSHPCPAVLLIQQGLYSAVCAGGEVDEGVYVEGALYGLNAVGKVVQIAPLSVVVGLPVQSQHSLPCVGGHGRYESLHLPVLARDEDVSPCQLPRIHCPFYLLFEGGLGGRSEAGLADDEIGRDGLEIYALLPLGYVYAV